MIKPWEQMTRQERIDHLKSEIVRAKEELKCDNPYQRESARSYLGTLARQLERYYR